MRCEHTIPLLSRINCAAPATGEVHFNNYKLHCLSRLLAAWTVVALMNSVFKKHKLFLLRSPYFFNGRWIERYFRTSCRDEEGSSHGKVRRNAIVVILKLVLENFSGNSSRIPCIHSATLGRNFNLSSLSANHSRKYFFVDTILFPSNAHML